MAIIPINCGCEDAPCCSCSEVMLTGEDALERMREEDDCNFERGFSTEQEALDNIHCHDEVDLFDLAVEDRMCGEEF